MKLQHFIDFLIGADPPNGIDSMNAHASQPWQKMVRKSVR
jgi:hypothetical protein